MADHPKIALLDRFKPANLRTPRPKRFSPGSREPGYRTSTPTLAQQFFCGLWTSTSGKWRVRYTEHEFCVLIEGRVRIESVTGDRYELRAGDAFVVPAGFEGTWEVAEPCKKWYAIFEAKT